MVILGDFRKRTKRCSRSPRKCSDWLTASVGANLEKILFALDVEDDWPPVASEGVWCERHGNDFKLLNAPLFIKGLACGDVFAAVPDPVNEHIFEFETIEESGHSLVWVLNNENIETATFKHQFLALGCSIAELERFSLFAIDVPPFVDKAVINSLVDAAEESGLDLAFPVWRHDVEHI